MNATSFEDGFHAGQMQERVAEHDRRLAAIIGSIDRAETAISALREDVGKIGVRVGIYAAMAAFVASIAGSIVTGVIVFSLIHDSGGTP